MDNARIPHFPSGAGSSRYIFDITDMIRRTHDRKISSRNLSGVPRTLLSLVLHACQMRPDAAKVGYFDNINGRYLELHDVGLLADFDALRAHLKKAVKFKRQFKTWKYKPTTHSYYYHAIRNAISHYCKKLISISNAIRGNVIGKSLGFRHGDTVVCLGSSWDSLDFLRYLRDENFITSNKVDLAVLVHDMIPLRMKTDGVVPTRHFEHWLQQICQLNAMAFVTSKSTADDLRDWCREHGYDHVRTGQFRLGDAPRQDGETSLRGEIQALMNQRYALMVGPVSGRKNGSNLIRAWRIIEEHIPVEDWPTLVIAVREGPSSLAACGLDEAEAAASKIKFIAAPSDSELRRLYENCMFTVFPSLYEGWGLPIGESLWHGKLCATSNRSSMPEVGGDDCEYFNPDDPRDIARVLTRLISNPAYLAERTQSLDRTRLRTWEEAAGEMLAALDALTGPGTATPRGIAQLEVAA